MNIDEIEKNLPNGNPNLSKVLSSMLNLMLTNQAMLESVMNTQRDILQSVYEKDGFDAEKYHNDCLASIEKRVAELMAQFASITL